MILVRDIFQLKFGKAREAMDLLRKNMGNVSKARNTPDRFLTDLTGQYYTLIMETHYENMTEYEQSMKDTFRSEEWRKGYQGFAELVESGRREIFTVVPVEQGQTQQRTEATAQVGRGR